MAYKFESELYKPVMRYFKNKSFTSQKVEAEFFERRIDLYAFSKKLNKSVAVELKLSNWKKALNQALIYQLCSDYVYLAMPVAAMNAIEVTKIKSYGVGIIAVYESGFCKRILPARKSKHVKKIYKGEIISPERSLS